MRLKKPTSCVQSGLHAAQVRVWIEQDRALCDGCVAPGIKCFVTDIGWSQQWRNFRAGRSYPLCFCERDARLKPAASGGYLTRDHWAAILSTSVAEYLGSDCQLSRSGGTAAPRSLAK